MVRRANSICVCECCGQTFSSYHSWTRYCNPKCREKDYMDKHPEQRSKRNQRSSNNYYDNVVYHPKTTSIKERVLSKVDWSGCAAGCSCWNWTASLDHMGYGQIAVPTGNKKSRNTKAHRVSYETFVGPVPKGMCVCHSCDNPQCVNPSHLWLGTQQDNINDKVKKGRQKKGRQTRLNTLTE